MRERPEDVAGALKSLEGQVARLSSSVDDRFDQVDAALVEQRQYTEFASARLEAKVDAGFASMEARFTGMDARFADMDGRFAGMDARFASMDASFASMDARFARIERKLDQFIDTQTKTNELVERRLSAVETSQPRRRRN